MPEDLELRSKVEQLNAMEFILSSVVEKLGQLSDYITTSPKFPVILEWQRQFQDQMHELENLIEQDFAKQDLKNALSRVVEMSSEIEDKEE